MLLIYSVTGSGRSQSLLFNENSGFRNIGFQIPISLHDNDNGNDDSGTHAVCIRFIQKSLCIHFPFPKFKSFPSSKIHGLFNSSFSSSKIHSFANHHFLHPTFTVYSNQHFLHPKIIVYSNHSFIFSKFMVIQINIFFIWNSQCIRIINIFIQYPLFILFSLFLAHLLVSIWIFIHGGISLCKETFMYSVRVQWFDNKIGTSCTCMSSKACSYMQWSLWVLKEYKIKICRCFVSTFLTNTGAYL